MKRPEYGEGRGGREEVEPAGEHDRVGGIDGGNIRGYDGERWLPEVLGIDSGHGNWTFWKVVLEALGFFGELDSCFARSRVSLVCRLHVFK